MAMQHIKQYLSSHKVLKRLQEKLADNGEKQAIFSLLSHAQRDEVISIIKTKKDYVVSLKSAYALHGIKAALRNFHYPVRVIVQRR